MEAQSRRLVPPGGLFDETAQVVTCSSEQALLQVFRWAQDQGVRLTLMGSARSFGHHFHPPADGFAVDISELGRGGKEVERESDGTIWVRVGGGTRFCDLKLLFPHHRVRFPPTSDRVTVAGALAACTHNSSGYFADEVRAFRLVTPRGDIIECSEQQSGLATELFRVVPGAFGALGATTEIEIRMWPIAAEQLFGVHSVYAGPSRDGKYLDVFEAVRDNPHYSEGAGAVVYGNRGHAIVLGDEVLPLSYKKHPKRQALLTDEAIEDHAFTQGLANRFPRIAETTVSKMYPQGRVRWAPWYGFHFYQRGYDRSFEVLGRKGLKYGLARWFGIDQKVPVYHQAWFFPRAQLRAFVDCYFQILDRFAGIEKRSEQQDMVLLPRCVWPAHSIGQLDEPVGVFTASYSIATLSSEQKARIAQFFQTVSREAYESVPGCRVSLSKQIHCDTQLLRVMHAPWIAAVRKLQDEVDPDRVLTSRHLAALLD